MTTIAYKDEILAFDSRISAKYLITDQVKKGIKTDKYLAAGCGLCGEIQSMLNWVESGSNFDEIPEIEDCVFVLIDRRGRIIEFTDSNVPVLLGKLKIYSAGSGGYLARGAMEFGATAEQSVAVAKRIDLATGGKIRTLSFSGRPNLRKRRK